MAETMNATKQSDANWSVSLLVIRSAFRQFEEQMDNDEATHAVMVSGLSVARSPKNEGDNASSTSLLWLGVG